MPTETAARERLAALMEDRRLELRLTWQQVAAAGGLSLKALHSIRGGTSDMRLLTRRAIEEGLRWEPGSVGIVLGGGDPVPLAAGEHPRPGRQGILEQAPPRIAEALAPYVHQMVTRITMAAAEHPAARDLEAAWVLPDRPDKWQQWAAFLATGREKFPPDGWSRQEQAQGFALLLLLSDAREQEEDLVG